MLRRFRPRSIMVGGVCLGVTLATVARIEPARAQAMQPSGFNAYDPQWAGASPYMSAGFGNTFAGSNQQAYTTKLGSGTVGLFVASNDNSAGAFGSSSNLFSPLSTSPASFQPNWFAGLGNSSWGTSVVGNYKSDPNAGLFNGLYSTASFGVTSFKSNQLGFSGLPGLSGGNDAVAMTAKAGVGLQLTPQISIEGSVGFTQIQGSNFR